MFKRILALLLALLIVLGIVISLAACSDGDEDDYVDADKDEDEDKDGDEADDPTVPEAPPVEIEDLLDRGSYSGTLTESTQSAEIATAGEAVLTNMVLNFHYQDYYSSLLSSGYIRPDTPLHMQYYDAAAGMTWEHYILQLSLDNWHQTVALCQQGENAGFEMPDAYAAEMGNLANNLQTYASLSGYDSADAYLQALYGPCNFEAFYQYRWDLYYSQAYLDHLIESLSVTDAEWIDYYNQHKAALEARYTTRLITIDIRHILIMPNDSTGADWAHARNQAENLLATFEAGDRTEQSFADLATAHTQDPGSQKTGGLYEDVYLNMMVKAFNDWCFDESRKPGDTGIVETEHGYHIMYFVRTEDAVAPLVAQEKLAQWLSDIPLDVAYEKIQLPTLSY